MCYNISCVYTFLKFLLNCMPVPPSSATYINGATLFWRNAEIYIVSSLYRNQAISSLAYTTMLVSLVAIYHASLLWGHNSAAYDIVVAETVSKPPPVLIEDRLPLDRVDMVCRDDRSNADTILQAIRKVNFRAVIFDGLNCTIYTCADYDTGFVPVSLAHSLYLRTPNGPLQCE